jgi:hypothetical protein
MGSRGNESGMDFEYENRTGPLDMQSPFAKLAQNQRSTAKEAQSRKRKLVENLLSSPKLSSLAE